MKFNCEFFPSWIIPSVSYLRVLSLVQSHNDFSPMVSLEAL